LDQVTR